MWFGEFQLAPDTSTYQGLKLLLAEVVPIDRDILHVVLGGLILLVCLLIWRRDWASGVLTALTVAFVIAVLMETLDARDDLRSFGHWRWEASVFDILRTISIPLIAFAVLRATMRRAG